MRTVGIVAGRRSGGSVPPGQDIVDVSSGFDVEDRTATVEDGEITEYKATDDAAFPVHGD